MTFSRTYKTDPRLQNLRDMLSAKDRPPLAPRRLPGTPAPDGLPHIAPPTDEPRQRMAESGIADRREASVTAQVVETANRGIDEKQQRIDKLEALLREFKDGLQELLIGSNRNAEELKKSEARRKSQSDVIAKDYAKIAELMQRCDTLDRRLQNEMGRNKAAMDFASLQIDRLKSDELASMAETARIRRAREEAERFLEAASRLDQHPGAAERSKAASMATLTPQ